jgi:hypothetical protein
MTRCIAVCVIAVFPILINAQYQVRIALSEMEVLELDEGPFDDAEDLIGTMALFGYKMANSRGDLEMHNSFENSNNSPRRLRNSIYDRGEVTFIFWDTERNYQNRAIIHLKKGVKHRFGTQYDFKNISFHQLNTLELRVGGNLIELDWPWITSLTFRFYKWDFGDYNTFRSYPSQLIRMNDYKHLYENLRVGQDVRFAVDLFFREGKSRVRLRFRISVENRYL